MSFKKDDKVTFVIEDIGTGGEGIGKVDGYTLFVKDAIIGDKIEAKIIKAKKNYGYARLEKIIEASSDRVTPACPVARQCGGCQIQQMSYQAQLRFKEKLVDDNLKRIGKIEGYEFFPAIGMEEPFRYRNKAQYPIGTAKDGSIVMGFYAGRTHSIISCTDCKIGAVENQYILAVIKSWMELNGVAPYDEQTGRGLVRHVLIRTGFHTDEIMVCLVINGTKMSDKLKESLVGRLTEVSLDSDISTDKCIKSIMLNYNTENTNVILGRQCETLWGKSYIEDYIGDIKYQISPLSFFQVNPRQTEKLYGKALEYAGLTGNETVWDLYCGIGTISLFLAKNARKVYGVEIVPQAIEDAKNNAAINGIDNAEFFVGKAEEVVPHFYEEMARLAADTSATEAQREEAKKSITPDVVVVDPPRKGCDESLLDTIVKMSPERIVYVSCDSATLARDLGLLAAKGYKTVKVQPVDQFSHTVHVETVVLLSQQKPDDTIEIDLDLDELDATSAELKATYQEIKDYGPKEFGLKASNLYISQIKCKYGIEVGENYNVLKSENTRVSQCPKEKEEATKAILKYYAMILRISMISRRNNRREKFFWELFPIIKKVYGKCINHMV